MQVVVKYLKKNGSGRELIRQKVIILGNPGMYGSWKWQEFVSKAYEHLQEGERIVSISEGGYH